MEDEEYSSVSDGEIRTLLFLRTWDEGHRARIPSKEKKTINRIPQKIADGQRAWSKPTIGAQMYSLNMMEFGTQFQSGRGSLVSIHRLFGTE
jgi:hypothetical protein